VHIVYSCTFISLFLTVVIQLLLFAKHRVGVIVIIRMLYLNAYWLNNGLFMLLICYVLLYVVVLCVKMRYVILSIKRLLSWVIGQYTGRLQPRITNFLKFSEISGNFSLILNFCENYNRIYRSKIRDVVSLPTARNMTNVTSKKWKWRYFGGTDA